MSAFLTRSGFSFLNPKNSPFTVIKYFALFITIPNFFKCSYLIYVALIGSNEMYVGKFTLRDMKTGKQTLVTFEQLIRKLHK